MSKILIGCFADDFTGASDAASFIKKAGLKTLLINGVPKDDEGIPDDVRAVVIALKTRTDEVSRAVGESLEAAGWLRRKGAACLYDKYCSTFDSTPEGNIGPIADAVLEVENLRYTVLCPALPVNGRTVWDGVLYVHGERLDESPMRNHPLTPMWDADIANLMRPQSKYPVFKLHHEMYKRSRESIMEEIDRITRDHDHCYIVPDYFLPEHARHIAEIFGDLPFLTGGSGILTELGRHHSGDGVEQADKESHGVGGAALILAGSCSQATLAQIQAFQSQGGISIKIDPKALLEDAGEVERIWGEIEKEGKTPVLAYSSESKENLRVVQEKLGRERVAEAVEAAMAALAQYAVDAGTRRIIVAGGETSGAVSKQLGFRRFYVGADVAPGVPVMIPVEMPDFRLVLKSGNFGGEGFFREAIEATGTEERA